MVTAFYHYNDVTDRRAANVRLFVFYLSLGLVWVCEMPCVLYMPSAQGPRHTVTITEK